MNSSVPSLPAPGRPSSSTVGMTERDQAFLAVALVVGTAVAMALLPALASWLLAAATWIPWKGPLELAVLGEEHLTVWGMAGVGGALGLLLTLLVVADEPVVEATERHLLVTKGDERHRFARGQVGEIRIEGKHLVVLDPDDVELLHLRVDRRRDITEVLAARGWPVS